MQVLGFAYGRVECTGDSDANCGGGTGCGNACNLWCSCGHSATRGGRRDIRRNGSNCGKTARPLDLCSNKCANCSSEHCVPGDQSILSLFYRILQLVFSYTSRATRNPHLFFVGSNPSQTPDFASTKKFDATEAAAQAEKRDISHAIWVEDNSCASESMIFLLFAAGTTSSRGVGSAWNGLPPHLTHSFSAPNCDSRNLDWPNHWQGGAFGWVTGDLQRRCMCRLNEVVHKLSFLYQSSRV